MKKLDTSVKAYLSDFRRRSGRKGLSRIEGFFDNLLGTVRAKTDDPRQRNGNPGWAWVPGLRAQPWFDPRECPSLVPVRAAFKGLLREAQSVLDKGFFLKSQDMRRDVNHKGWMTFDLRTIDLRAEKGSFSSEVLTNSKNLKRAPIAAALSEPMPLVGDYCYLGLRPGGYVSPHYSQFNAKLVCHLGLSVPDDCGIRVAGETRRWEEKELLVFDDTYLHDTWNHSSQPRIIFQSTVWHPDLTPLEIEALTGWFERSASAA